MNKVTRNTATGYTLIDFYNFLPAGWRVKHRPK